MFSVSLSHSNLDRSDAAGTVHNRRVPSELLDTRWSPRELNATLATPESWPGSGSPIGSMAVRPGATRHRVTNRSNPPVASRPPSGLTANAANSPEWVVGWFAITRIGAVAVLLNTYNKAAELGRTIRHSDQALLLTVGSHLGHDYLDRLEQAASQVSALVRDRDRLRRPLEIARHVVRNGTAEVPMLEIDEYGMHTDRLDIDRYAESPAHLEQERQAMAGYRLDVDALAELEAVLAAAQADGVEVVLVQLPVYERHYLALQPGLTERDAAFVTATEQLAERAGIRYLDARGELDWDDPTLWADVNHLNGNGTARLTDWLVDRLDAA